MAAAWRSFLTHLECSACGLRHDADQLQTVCTACGKVLFARYDLEGVRQSVKPTDFASRRWDMWRYGELLPVRDVTNVISLGEGRLLEAITGERMPRRPVHPGPPASWWSRIGSMLADARTWTTLLYFLIMLPLGIIYFVIATVGLSVGLKLAAAPFVLIAERLGWLGEDSSWFEFHWHHHWGHHWTGFSTGSLIGSLLMLMVGVVVLTVLMHAARGIARAHARLAKALLVEPGA